MKKSKLFWGFVLILMAVCLIFGQYDILSDISIWKIIFTLFGVAAIIDGIFSIDIGSGVVGLVILLFLWKNQIGLDELSGWTIILAGLLLAAGLSILLHPFRGKIEARKMRRKMEKYREQIGGDNPQVDFTDGKGFTENPQGYNGSYVKLKRNFGGGIEYVRSNQLQQVDVELNFSGLTVYFDDAEIQGPEAVMNIDVNFSGLEIYVPSEWAVENHMNQFAGGVEEKPRRNNVAVTKTLRLVGNVAFGGITVYYI